MTKYRVIQQDGRFYPEKQTSHLMGLFTSDWLRFLGFVDLLPVSEVDETVDFKGHIFFRTKEEAVAFCKDKQSAFKGVKTTPSTTEVWNSNSETHIF